MEAADQGDQKGLVPLLHEVNSAAGRISVSRSTLYEEMKAGRIASVTIGRRRFVPESALIEYVQRLQSEQRGGADENSPPGTTERQTVPGVRASLANTVRRPRAPGAV